MSILPGEHVPTRRPIDSLSTMYREGYYGGALRVHSQSIGASQWKNLVDQTQADGVERGIVISTNKGSILTSRIYMGSGTEEIFDGAEMRKRGGSFTPPNLPHGIRSLNPSTKDIVVVHSHVMPPSSDHLPTTILSDEDILNFIHSKYHALCAIDRGGAHLLVRTQKQLYDKTLDAHLVKGLIAENVKENGGIKDVIVRVSKRLQQFRLAYLYTSQLEPDSEGAITFQEPTK